MKAKLLLQEKEKTWAIVFDPGDEVAAGLKAFARDHQLSASHFTGIGAFSDVLLGFFSLEKKQYKKIPIRTQVEVLSLVGDITLDDEEPQVHAHVVVGKADGTAHGGHLLQAHVRPTLEVILTETPRHLHRKLNPDIGLSLINLEQPG